LYRDGDANQSQTLPALWENLLGSDPTVKWNFASEPNAVVINLGTNDWTQGDPGAPFEIAYDDFLHRVREKYPNTWIFLTIGPMLEEYRRDQILARLSHVLTGRVDAGDARISMFDFGSQDGSTTGCLVHPGVAEHERMAKILEEHLVQALGWQ
jgi:hypothetical protein